MPEEISHIFYIQTAVKIWKSESDSRLLHSYKLKITSCGPSKQSHSLLISMFHCAFFNSIIDKTPTHALFIQHYFSLPCWFH